MSKRIQHSIGVYEMWRDLVMERIEQDGYIAEQEAEDLLTLSFAHISREEGIKTETVLAQMTTQMNMHKPELVSLMKNHLMTVDKKNSEFAHKLCKYSCQDDNMEIIRDILAEISAEI